MTEPVIDYTTPVGQVRLLVADVTRVTQGKLPDSALAYIFSDAQIEGYLAINSGNVKYAAADAVSAIGLDEALISKVIKTEDLQTDGAKLLEAIRKLAAEYRKAGDKDQRIDDAVFVMEPGNSSVYLGTLHDGLWPWL